MRFFRVFPRSSWFSAGVLFTLLLLLLSARAYTLRHLSWKLSPHRHPVIVGYFPQWGLTQEEPYYVKNLINNGGVKFLDQINYAEGFVAGGRCSVADPKADLNFAYTSQNSVNGVADDPASAFHGYFHQFKELKQRYPRLKILISLEGKAEDFSEDAKPENRQAFVASCMDTFLRGHFAAGIHEPGIFDGFDIDWESPAENEAGNFRALVEEFRRQMNALRPGLWLSIAVGHTPRMLPGTDFEAIAPLVDEVGIMNYDYTGPWNPTTGFLAPLFSSPADPRYPNSIAESIASYVAAGVPREKLLMGVPFYGYSWTAVDKTNDGLFQAGQGVSGDKPYRYIRSLTTTFPNHRDQQSRAPWLFDGATFWTYEDPVSIRYKVSFAARQHLGGVMIWELGEDTADAELLSATHQSLLHPLHDKAFAEAVELTNPAANASRSVAAPDLSR